jgi:hypothetical protein
MYKSVRNPSSGFLGQCNIPYETQSIQQISIAPMGEPEYSEHQ